MRQDRLVRSVVKTALGLFFFVGIALALGILIFVDASATPIVTLLSACLLIACTLIGICVLRGR